MTQLRVFSTYKTVYPLIVSGLLLFMTAGCQPAADVPTPEVGTPTTAETDEALSGGVGTSFDATSKAYTFPLTGLTGALLAQHQAGDALFEATFVAPPAQINAGLGPIFNNTSCRSCHTNDGRARVPVGDEPFNGLLFRISGPGQDAHGGPLAAAGFGLQVQTRAVFGTQPEMDIQIDYEAVAGSFSDGETYALRKPTYTPTNTYIPLPPGAMLSPRIANPNFGLGLLAAVPDATLAQLADEADVNGDGISGRLNWVWNYETNQRVVGRFGWKASQPTLKQQAAAALEGDVGITTPLFPNEASLGQLQDVPTHNPELSNQALDELTVYLQTLAVPARRTPVDKTVLAGKGLFAQAGCGGCHVPRLQTGPSAVAQLANQTIRPYTDLLLHDMGEALSDGRPDYVATAREWRTAPLWGIGLNKLVSGHTQFLHDGRARSITEAILWHGGEAQKSREAFRTMPKSSRTALLTFLESL